MIFWFLDALELDFLLILFFPFPNFLSRPYFWRLKRFEPARVVELGTNNAIGGTQGSRPIDFPLLSF